jgi:hypothetical protein
MPRITRSERAISIPMRILWSFLLVQPIVAWKVLANKRHLGANSQIRTEGNLPATGRGLDPGLTAAEMKRCVWVKPIVVCEVKFTEWTRDDRLRHPVFLGIRNDKSSTDVVREMAG